MTAQPDRSTSLIGAILYRMWFRGAGRIGGAVGVLGLVTAIVLMGGVVGTSTVGNHARDVPRVASPGDILPRVASPDDPVVEGARFAAVFELDGALRVDPPTGAPTVPESRAISLLRAARLTGNVLGDVVIGFGLVTLRADLTPSGQPRMTRQPSWVVSYGDVGIFGCPAQGGPFPPGPVPRPVFILDATTATHGISYLSRGSRCGYAPVGPEAHTASVLYSVPWTEIGRSPNGGSVIVRSDPPCTAAQIWDSGQTPMEGAVLRINAVVPLSTATCPPGRPHTRDFVEPIGPLRHDAVGLVGENGTPPPRGFQDSVAHPYFQYFDGHLHTLT